MSREPMIFDIKTATIRKSERQILPLIYCNLGIVENDVEIFRFSIHSKSQI